MRRVLLAVFLAAAAHAQQPQPVTLALTQGTLRYTVVHKLHEVTGTTHELEGLARLTPGAPTLVQVRAPIKSFDSGNSNRDAHMREATHEPLHPIAEVKGTLPPIALPLDGARDLTLDARVELNGVQRKEAIPVHLEPAGARGVHGTFSFPISLDAFGVERPELLLIKIDDRAVIAGDVLFEARP
jgi:polyisoprenoid-binding protein YceI